jgi:anti-sigma-K factor RskA
MNWRRYPELQERLAAEYVLGTLRGRPRRRFEQWLAEDTALAARVADWEARLSPLAGGVDPVHPPERLWRRIEARLAEEPRAARGLWDSTAFWRGLGLVASGAAASLVAVVAWIAPERPAPAPAPIVLQVPGNEIPASYLAVLTDPATQRPVMVVSAGRKEKQVWTKTIDPAIHVADRSLELWALPENGAPRSLGVVSADEKVMLALPAIADVSLAGVSMLAVSLEPRGGSPTGAPTGPVLYKGPCVKYW